MNFKVINVDKIFQILGNSIFDFLKTNNYRQIINHLNLQWLKDHQEYLNSTYTNTDSDKNYSKIGHILRWLK